MNFRSTACLLMLAGNLVPSLTGGVAFAQQIAVTPPPVAVDPIISDDEFKTRLPVLDPELDSPLPSIAEWEAEQKRLDQLGTPQNGVPQRPAIPALPDPLALDPAAIDPVLDAPLVPLAEFDVEPFDEGQFTEAEVAAANVRYGYRIAGLDGPPPEPGRATGAVISAAESGMAAIKRRFDGLSALADGGGQADNGTVLSAWLREDQQLLRDLLSSEGFFDASVEARVTAPAKLGERLTAVLTIVPGPRYVFGSIGFDAPPLIPDDLIRRNFVPEPGEPIIADHVLAAEANIAVQLSQNGYPFAEVGQRDILLDSENGTGDYRLPVKTGARSSFGEIVTSGRAAFDAAHIAVIARFDPGELYDSRMVDDLRQALIATGLFSTIAISPEPTTTPGPDGTMLANLNVVQEAGPPRTIAGNAGYSTGQGIRLEGSWTHRNLFPPEGALIGAAVIGTREQGLSATFRRSNAARRDRTVELGVSALHSDYEAYEAFTGRLSGRVSYDSTPIWQKRLTYGYGFDLIATNEQDYDFILNSRNRRTYYLFALPGEVGFDTTTSLLNPTSGFRVGLRLSPEGSLGAETQIYVRSLLDATAYYPVSDDLVLAGRARFGSILGSARANIAPSRRYYAGGGGSVRGFGYQQLGPKDPAGRPIGGRSLVEGAAEVRYRFGNYGIVGFVDAGQVSTGATPGFDNMRFGVGLGGRFYTNFGPLRVDVATPIDRQPGESRFSFYISIGQAF